VCSPCARYLFLEVIQGEIDMRQSESVKAISEALVKAQSKFGTLPKDKDGYGYKYTDIDTVISYIRPILAECGLAFMQALSTIDGKSAMTTRVLHTSGEWIEDTIILPDVSITKSNAAQNMGASITYMRRYSLCAVLGISADEDTDAVVEPKITEPYKSKEKPKSKFTDEQMAQMKRWNDGTFTAEELADIKKRLAGKDFAKVIEETQREYEKRTAVF
jgi:hypothetical protein